VLRDDAIEFLVIEGHDIGLSVRILDDPLADGLSQPIIVRIDRESPRQLAGLKHRKRIRRIAALSDRGDWHAGLLCLGQRELNAAIVN
jgi:hypothetical protein